MTFFQRLKSWTERLYIFQLFNLITSSLNTVSYVPVTHSSIAFTTCDSISKQLITLLNVYKQIVSDGIYDNVYGMKDSSMNIFLNNVLGWHLFIAPSKIHNAGHGLFLNSKLSYIPAGTLLCIYPGTIYSSWDPIFFQSINNSYIIRLSNGSFIDGKNTGLSKSIYLSTRHKNQISHDFNICDDKWLYMQHPFGLGQIINNGKSPNVVYHELNLIVSKDIRDDSNTLVIPFKDCNILRLLPNVRYSGTWQDINTPMRLIVLVSIRDIQPREELYSAYMTRIFEHH